MRSQKIDRRSVLAGVLAAPGCATRPLGLEEIVSRHVQARGGAAALDAVRTCSLDIEITEDGQTFPLRYIASTERLVRVDVILGGVRAYSEGVDRQGVWLWPADASAASPSVADGSANALLHGVETNLVGLHRFAERGARLALMPPETLDGVRYQTIKCTFATGHVTYFYVDPESWLIARKRDQRAYHPDVDSTQRHVESRYSDFQTVAGVLASHRNEDYDLDRATLLATARVLARRLNPDLPEGVFDRTYRPV